MSDLEKRLAALETALAEEQGVRCGQDMLLLNRIRHIEEICLNPAVQKHVQRTVPWPLRWLGLGPRLAPYFWERSRRALAARYDTTLDRERSASFARVSAIITEACAHLRKPEPPAASGSPSTNP